MGRKICKIFNFPLGQEQAERSIIEQGALLHVLVISYIIITGVPMFIYSQTWSIVIKCIFGACVAAKRVWLVAYTMSFLA